jgi:tetratricopeptide (TPR) repeat protein
MQRDYILRMIEQLAVFVAGLRGLRAQEQWDAFQRELEDGYARFAGLHPSLVHAVSEDDLVTMLHARGTVDLDRWWGLAELLREEGLALEAQGNVELAEAAFVKSLRVYLEVLEEADELPRQLRVTDLEEVVDRVADGALSQVTRSRLVRYLLVTNRLDKAENVVAWGLEEPDPDGRRHDAARAFYDDLLRYPDDQLLAGGLSREEVRMARAELDER